MTARLASALALCLFAAVPAAGQTFRPPDPTSRPWATAGLTLGPIYFAPTFEVRDVGVDNNVFNDRSNPKSDLTGTLAVRSLFGLHFGESFVLRVGLEPLPNSEVREIVDVVRQVVRPVADEEDE